MKTNRAFLSFLVVGPLFAAPILGLMLCLPAHAAVYTWIGGTDNSWTNAANWDANGVPVDVDASGGLTFASSTSDRIVIDATTFSPTTNVPQLYATSGTNVIPTIDVSNGSVSFTTSTNLSVKGMVTESNYSATIGDGVGSKGSASINYNTVNYTVRGGAMAFVVNSDGELVFTSSLALSYNAVNSMTVNLAGGSVTFNNAIDLLRASTAAGNSYFDFTATGASFTADFGGDFIDIATIESTYIGDGLTFRSSTALTLAAQDNLDGTFTVTAIPEPKAALLGSIGILLLLRRRR